jgi:hypothetical protein
LVGTLDSALIFLGAGVNRLKAYLKETSDAGGNRPEHDLDLYRLASATQRLDQVLEKLQWQQSKPPAVEFSVRKFELELKVQDAELCRVRIDEVNACGATSAFKIGTDLGNLHVAFEDGKLKPRWMHTVEEIEDLGGSCPKHEVTIANALRCDGQRKVDCHVFRKVLFPQYDRQGHFKVTDNSPPNGTDRFRAKLQRRKEQNFFELVAAWKGAKKSAAKRRKKN